MTQITYEVLRKPFEDRIIEAACIYWDVERTYFSSPRPCATVAYRKSIIYYLIKENTNFTLSHIASKLGFTTHGPVARLIDNIEAQKNIFKPICNDLKQISLLADRLDAQFVTTSVQLVNRKLENEV